MIENLTDKEIIQGLRQYDEKITSEFFYDTCHMAYYVDNKKYGLRHKSGMDFYSLAHEYYLRLCNNDWQQLEKCKPGFTLANWTMNGFHYLVRERLKNYSLGNWVESLEERASNGKMVFDVSDDNSRKEVVDMVEDICHNYYASDRKSQSILRMILVMGMKGKEVAATMGITPAAVSQRYNQMMNKVVRPYFLKYYHHEPPVMMSETSFSHMPSRVREDASPVKRKSLSISMDKIIVKRSKESRKRGIRAKLMSIWNSRVTPPVVSSLRENEVFVFGSDLRGVHCGGTAYQALRSFGGVLGQGVGPQGRCYAIPTIVGGLENVIPYVREFISYANDHPEQVFLVTSVGCGIAGFSPDEIAPLFAEARDVSNIHLPKEFWKYL